MSTPYFQPTPEWNHALEMPTCPYHLLLVVERRGQIAGWCRLYPWSGCEDNADEVELGIGVMAEYRGNGLGKALVGQALDWVARAGVERVTLTTRAGNSRAIHLFEVCGFAVTGRDANGWIEMAYESSSWGG